MKDERETFRIVPSRTAGVPSIEFAFSMRVEAELLEGDTENLAQVARELASYIERRDEQMGMLASRQWALLVDSVRVEPAPRREQVVDVRRSEVPRRR